MVLQSLVNAPRDVYWLLAMRTLRMVAFGQTALFLALYLEELGIDGTRIGVFMSATLAGDLVISFLLTLFADALGRKRILIYGALMMALSGMVFAWTNNYWLLLFAAVIGVISPGGNEIGPFKAVEESCLAQLVTLESRADLFAWHSVLGMAGQAVGSLSGGFFVTYLVSQGHSLSDAYRGIYVMYAAIGIGKLLCTAMLSSDIEIESRESAPLLQRTESTAESPQKKKKSWLPKISKESRRITILVSLLFFVDTLASAMATISWSSFYVAKKFLISEASLGSIFFTTGLISSVGSFVGSAISRRLGPVLTMVLTHLPSSTLLIFVPLPDTLSGTLAIMILRSCTSNMDNAPRQTFLSSVVLPHERTAVLGWTNVVRTMAHSVAPIIVGKLVSIDKQWIAFVAAGVLKVLYDLGILGAFSKIELDRDE